SSSIWEWNGTNWTQRIANGPSARGGAAMVFDSSRGVSALFGGSIGSTPTNEMWEWDGIGWLLRSPTQSWRRPRVYPSLAFDSSRNVIVLQGGRDGQNHFLNETWEYAAGIWHERNLMAVPAFAGAGMAYDTFRNTMVLVAAGRTW